MKVRSRFRNRAQGDREKRNIELKVRRKWSIKRSFQKSERETGSKIILRVKDST